MARPFGHGAEKCAPLVEGGTRVFESEVPRLGSGPEATHSPSRLWTVSEVADLLVLKESTIRAYAERGTLPCVRIGNRLRFLPSDISAWIESRHSKGVT